MTREFYATVQNKMYYAVHGNTAAEVIVNEGSAERKIDWINDKGSIRKEDSKSIVGVGF